MINAYRGHYGDFNILKKRNMWFPWLQEKINHFLQGCDECMIKNIKSALHDIRTFPSPKSPFVHVAIDFVDMITQVKWKRYMLVVVDRFLRWDKDFAVEQQSGEAVVAALTKEIIPRFRIPSIIQFNFFRFVLW